MIKHLLLLIVTAVLVVGEAYATQCTAIFPGPQSFTTNSVDSIEGGVTCNGSNCSPEPFTAASPYPSFSSTGNFKLSTIVGGTTYAHNSWNTSENQTVSYIGTGTAIIYIKNDATIKKGVKINVGGNPANVLMIFNKKLKIEEGAVISAFIYVNGSETNIEKNSTINGGIAVKTKLILKENSTYTYTPADADNIDAPIFCESSAVPSPPPSSCAPYFLDSAQGNTSSSKIKFKNSSKLILEPDNTIQFPSMTDDTSGFSCNTVDCAITSSSAPALTLSIFETTATTSDVSINAGTATIGSGGTYSQNEINALSIDGSANVTFLTSTDKYIITTATFTDSAVITFNEGEYWFDFLEILGSTQIIVNGPVTIFVKDHFDIEGSSLVNVSGPAKNLALVGYNKIHLKNSVQVHGVIYNDGGEEIKLQNSASLTGAVSASGKLELKNDSNIIYENIADVKVGDLCGEVSGCVLGGFRITQPVVGLACPSSRSYVDIQALCTDGSTSKTDYAGTIDLTTNENSNSDFYAASTGGSAISSVTLDGSEGGASNVYLFHKNENQDLKVTATDSDTSESSTASTGTDFRTTGFAITDPGNFVCGSSSSVTLTAIGQSETGSGACSVLTGFTGSKSLKAWFSVNYDPDTPGVAGAVNTPIGLNNTNVSDNSSPTATNFVLGFNSGEATVDITHLDAGEILGINFTHDDLVAGTDDVAGSVNSFVVRPNTITLSTNNASSACTSGDASCTKFVAAGSAFDLNAIAECADASKTTALSYQTPSASPVGLSLNLIAPTDTGSVNGDLGLTTLDFDDGDITNSQSVSEVGVFTITATPPAYFFQAIAASTSENIGRFYPDHFDVVVNSGGFDSSCGDFTYIGQDFTYDPLQVPSLTITAMNAATISEATQNYTVSDFMKLLAGDITRVFPLTDTQTGKDGIALMAVETTLSAGEALTAVGAGVMTYSFDAADLYRYTKNANAEIGPFDSSLSVVINDFQDVDGANASAVPDVVPTAAGSGGDSNRYGRMVMQNAYGPETDDLAMEAYTEFLAATSGQYVLNTTDNCTNLLSTIAVDPLGASGTENHTAIPVGSGTSDFSYNPLLIGGEAGFLFTAPGAGNDGDIDVSIELLTFPWLQYDWDGDGTLQNPPSTTASFGQYRGHDRIIYWREVQ
mgnify:CR=1 FL=1